MTLLLALSGPVGVGKSSVQEALKARFDVEVVSTRKLLTDTGAAWARESLQQAGERLDRETGGRWVWEGLAPILEKRSEADIVVVDAIRIKGQIDHIRRAVGHRMKVWHVFLDASEEVLAERYARRDSPIAEFPTYGQLQASATEAAIRSLRSVVDRVVDTTLCDPASVAAQAIAGLGLYPLEVERLVDVIVGAQYGSEGKGHMCAHLAPAYDLLVRVGGPNAGHKVKYPKRTFVQLPSGTECNEKAGILIGAGATIWLPKLQEEIEAIGLSPSRLSIDPQAMIIEELDREYEERSMDAIGSTKQGVGAATARKILGRDSREHLLGAKVRLARDIDDLRPFLKPVADVLERAYARGERVFLEGTQGTDLSLHHASYPHVTSRDTTVSGCLADAGIAPGRVRKVIMVTRTYPIRVGGESGPMIREIDSETIAERSGLPLDDIERTELGSVSGKPRRMAEFDWEQVRRAAVLNGATDVALSFADYIDARNRKARRFEDLSAETRDFVEGVERVTNAPVSLISTRFEPRGIIDRRTWR